MATKKNHNSEDTIDTQKFVYWQPRLQLLITLAGMVTIIAGLWLTANLQPIKQDLAILTKDVQANQEHIQLQNDDIKLVEEKIDKLLYHFGIPTVE